MPQKAVGVFAGRSRIVCQASSPARDLAETRHGYLSTNCTAWLTEPPGHPRDSLPTPTTSSARTYSTIALIKTTNTFYNHLHFSVIFFYRKRL